MRSTSFEDSIFVLGRNRSTTPEYDLVVLRSVFYWPRYRLERGRSKRERTGLEGESLHPLFAGDTRHSIPAGTHLICRHLVAFEQLRGVNHNGVRLEQERQCRVLVNW